VEPYSRKLKERTREGSFLDVPDDDDSVAEIFDLVDLGLLGHGGFFHVGVHYKT
jgi:hypothetical protein